MTSSEAHPGKVDVTPGANAGGSAHCASEESCPYKTFFDRASDGLGTLDRKGTITSCNDALVDLHGCDGKDDLLGRPFWEDLSSDPEVKAAALAGWRETLATGRGVLDFRTKIRRRDTGEDVDVSVNALPSAKEGGGIQFILRNITERARAEEATARLASIVESASDAIIGTDLDGIIVTVNSAAERLFRYRAEEIVGRTFDLLVPECRRGEGEMILTRLLRGDSVRHFETARRRKDGSLMEVSLAASPITDGEGRVMGTSRILHEITDRKEMERRLQAAHDDLESRVEERTAELKEARRAAEVATEAKSDFLATMSHDLRTPLNSIIGFADLLASRSLPAGESRHVELIRRNGRLLLDLIEQLLDLRAMEQGASRFTPEAIDLAKLMTETAEMFEIQAEERGITFEAVRRPGAEEVWQDRVALLQVIHNLVSNSFKFTDPKGSVTLTVSAEDADRFRVSVSDTGSGIEPAQLERAFDRLEQLGDSPRERGHGVGLGLAIVRSICTAQGGETGATSEPGRGSTFWAVLPRDISARAAARAEQRPA